MPREGPKVRVSGPGNNGQATPRKAPEEAVWRTGSGSHRSPPPVGAKLSGGMEASLKAQLPGLRREQERKYARIYTA